MGTNLQNNYTTDILIIKLLIVIVLIIFIIATMNLIRNRSKYNSYKAVAIYISLGLFILFFSSILNSFDSGHWNVEYIMAFLSLIHVKDEITYPFGFFLRRLAILGYLLFFWGLVNLIIVRINRKKRGESIS